jgi:uncharacterized Zn finger protein
MANKTKTKTESEYLQEVQEAMIQLRKNTAVRKAKSDRLKTFWTNPQNRERMIRLRNTPESKRKQSESMKSFLRNHPEQKIKRIEHLNLKWIRAAAIAARKRKKLES